MTRLDDLSKMIFEIESSNFQKVKECSQVEAFELKADTRLLTNLSGNCGALFIRAMLDHLNIDESRVFKWRLENKFKQYQILNYYIPGCMPETLSFSKVLKQNDGVEKIKNLFSKGFFIKATLGDASFATNSWDKTAEFDHISQLPTVTGGHYETYMLQKKLHIKCEFRVHTFSKEVIPGLIYVIRGEGPSIDRNAITTLVKEVLQRLPDAILEGTLIGWDIALTEDNHYSIIEANFTGFHPEYRAGFQTTGYVDDQIYGPIICAWLNTYFYETFKVYIDAIEDSLFVNYPFYKAFIFYLSTFRNVHLDLVKTGKKEIALSVIIYLGEETNTLIVYLIKHFLLVAFAIEYYVIIRGECFFKVNELFKKNRSVQLCAESSFFTKDQFQVVMQMSYDRKKQICCYHALRRFKGKSCVIV